MTRIKFAYCRHSASLPDGGTQQHPSGVTIRVPSTSFTTSGKSDAQSADGALRDASGQSNSSTSTEAANSQSSSEAEDAENMNLHPLEIIKRVDFWAVFAVDAANLYAINTFSALWKVYFASAAKLQLYSAHICISS